MLLCCSIVTGRPAADQWHGVARLSSRTNPVHFPSPQLVYGESISTPDARTVVLGTFSACELDVHPHAPIRNPERWAGGARFWPCSPISSHRVPLAPPVPSARDMAALWL
jgi:hypothetical protein